VWVAGDGLLQCSDGIRYVADLEAGESEVVLDDGVGRLQLGCIAQRRDRIRWSTSPEELSGQRQKRHHLLRRRILRLGHGDEPGVKPVSVAIEIASANWYPAMIYQPGES